MHIHIKTAHFHVPRTPALAGALISAALGSVASSQEFASAHAAPAAAVATPPKIGQYWKGQGGIYLGLARSFDERPDPHVVLATDPRAIFVKRMLGTYGVDVTGACSDHDSLANTIALAAAGSELCQEILALEIEGHRDYALMSRQDARLGMANAPEQFEKVWHLLSTQYSSDNAWFQTFTNGNQSYNDKKFEASGRLVRRFVL